MTVLSAIWQDSDAAEVLFLIAAIAFALEAILDLVGPRTSRVVADDGRTRGFTVGSLVGFFLAVGLTLVALGLLAL